MQLIWCMIPLERKREVASILGPSSMALSDLIDLSLLSFYHMTEVFNEA